MLIVLAECGSVNFNRLYNLSLYLMDFNKPCVIQEDFLCLYLLTLTLINLLSTRIGQRGRAGHDN